MRKLMLAVISLIALIATACSGGASNTAPAGLPQAKEGTLLRKVQDRGKLVVGTKYDAPTMGYNNPQTKQVEGFDPAIAREIAAYIFGDATKVEFKEVIPANRIPWVKDGTVDLILATMTITEARLKDVDFSVVYNVAGQRLLVHKDSPIKSTAELANKKAGVAKSSTSADNLRKLTKATVVEFDSWGDAVKALVTKQIDVVSTDDNLLYGFQFLNPGLQVVGSQFSYEPYGAAFLKDQPDFANGVNTVIKNLKTSGKWKTLWKAEVGDKVGITVAPEPPGDEWKK